MPDLNSLPPSPMNRTRRQSISSADHAPTSPLATGRRTSGAGIIPHLAHSPSSSGSHSLTAAATMNAGLHNEAARRASGIPADNDLAARRRSSIQANLDLNDPVLPGPGEMARSPAGLERLRTASSATSPVHHRNPSLGDMHQSLENESEAQVNRLRRMIHQEHETIQQTQGSSQAIASPSAVNEPTVPAVSSAAAASVTGHSTFSTLPQGPRQPPTPTSAPSSRSPFIPPRSLSRHSSYHSVASPSPSIRPLSGHFPPNSASESADFPQLSPYPPSPSMSHSRDEASFIQAEMQTYHRENEMLRARINRLETELAGPDAAIVSPTASVAGE